jgi:hypothetical protein
VRGPQRAHHALAQSSANASKAYTAPWTRAGGHVAAVRIASSMLISIKGAFAASGEQELLSCGFVGASRAAAGSVGCDTLAGDLLSCLSAMRWIWFVVQVPFMIPRRLVRPCTHKSIDGRSVRNAQMTSNLLSAIRGIPENMCSV